jgi:hypothetical protein
METKRTFQKYIYRGIILENDIFRGGEGGGRQKSPSNVIICAHTQSCVKNQAIKDRHEAGLPISTTDLTCRPCVPASG